MQTVPNLLSWMHNKEAFKPSKNFPAICIFSIGILLLLLCLCLTYFSALFNYDHAVFDMPVLWVTGGLTLAGLIYLPMLPLIRKSIQGLPLQPRVFLTIAVLIGVAMRLFLIPGEPVLEDDYQRYLWDGAVTAKGFNPYQYSPDAIKANPDIPNRLVELSSDAGQVVSRINHSELRTIYPMVAQSFFALSHWLTPWSITTWKLILFFMDLMTLYLLLALLKEVGMSPIWSLIYWWNPVVLKELFNSGHMEGILIPFVLASVLLSLRRHYWQSSFLLGLATGIKVWPLLLLPLLTRPIWGHPTELAKSSIAFAIVTAIIFAPVLVTELDASSGFIAYAQNWKTNSALTPLVELIFQQFKIITGMEAINSSELARFTLAGLILVMLFLVCTGTINSSQEHLRRVSILVTAIFFLSPAQFPWYLLWVLPFMCIFPIYGIYILTATIPLYYTAFYLYPREMNFVFSQIIVWIIWLPGWALLAFQAQSLGLSGKFSDKTGSRESI